jgi:hypothetical protein
MRFCQRHFVGALLSAIFYRRNFALRYFVGQPKADIETAMH